MDRIPEGKLLITNIQRFSLQDGPGIRTTVFLKGCPLHCPWCCNPENISFYPELYYKNGNSGIYGQYMDICDVKEILLRDRAFYTTGGGITYSGGEPLSHARVLKTLLKELREEGLHQTFETSLFASKDSVILAAQLANLFLVDVKILDVNESKRLIGGELSKFEQNLSILFSLTNQVVFRVPFVSGMTDGRKNVDAIIQLLEIYRPLRLEVMMGHNLGISKYKSLGLEQERVKPGNGNEAKRLVNKARAMGVDSSILRV